MKEKLVARFGWTLVILIVWVTITLLFISGLRMIWVAQAQEERWAWDGTNFTLLQDGTTAPIQQTNRPAIFETFTNMVWLEPLTFDGTIVPITATNIYLTVAIIRQSSEYTNVVNALVEQGDVCKVRGHKWGWHVNTYAVYQPGVEYRECAICGRVQSRTQKDWQ